MMAALLYEAKTHNLGSTAHLDQIGVVRMNAREASRLGLGTLTHYYGLFESLLKDYSIQPYPMNQNYNDEQQDRKSTRLNSSHGYISYAVFCLKKKKKKTK